MNRLDFQNLADIRIAEAKKLLDEGMPDGAYYLAGYAVECALKACIAKHVNQYDFPPKKTTNLYTHDLVQLLAAAKLESQLKIDCAVISGLEDRWQTVVDWSEESRYERAATAVALTLIEAITNPSNGVLSWVKNYW